MNYTVIVGLMLQTACIGIILHRFRWKTFQYTGALFLLMTFVYHGYLAEVLNVIFPERNIYRELVSEESIGYTVLLFSTGMCLYTMAYLIGLKASNSYFKFKPQVIDKINDILTRCRNILIVITIACYVISYYFSLSTGFDELSVSSEYWIYGLAVYLLPQFMLIATLAVILSRKNISVEMVLVIQILVNVTAMARSAVLFSLLITMIIVAALGYAFDRRKIYVLFSLAVAILLLISISRGLFGREGIAGMSPLERLEAIATSAGSSDDETKEYVLDDFVFRFDGNSSNALILDSLNEGYEVAGITPIMIDVFLQVPRFLNPEKLESDLLIRNSEAFTFAYYGHDPTIDYCQGWLGYFLACFGKVGLLISMTLLGFIFSKLDNWFVTTTSALSTVIYYSAIYNIIYYEGVMSYFLSSLRTIIIVVICVQFINFMTKKSKGLCKVLKHEM